MASIRRCEFCNDPLPKGSRPARKYCSDDCRKGRTRPAAPEVKIGPVETGLDAAIAEAGFSKLDAATVAAARVLARRIDEDAERWEYAMAWNREQQEQGARPKPPPTDNVSLPTFLNYCTALGLSPAARKVTAADPGKGAGGGSKLGRHLEAVPRPSR